MESKVVALMEPMDGKVETGQSPTTQHGLRPREQGHERIAEPQSVL